MKKYLIKEFNNTANNANIKQIIDFAEDKVQQLQQNGQLEQLKQQQLLKQLQNMNAQQLQTAINAFNMGMGDSLGIQPQQKQQVVNYLKQILHSKQNITR